MGRKKLSSAAIEAAQEQGAVAVIERPAPARAVRIDQPPPEWGMLPLGVIDRSPTNPRQVFDDRKLEELAESIVRFGIQQPLTVRRVGDRYELIAGERRFRAARMAELEQVPAIVRQYSDSDVLELQLIENRQREDVHPIEEARHFKRILEAKTYGEGIPAIEAIAAKVGLSTSFVYQRLKLLDLADEAQDAFLKGFLTPAHAVMIARLQPKDQVRAVSECCYVTNYEGRRSGSLGDKSISVKALADWIARNILMKLSGAPWKKDDALLLPKAGSCTDCPKRTGATANLFGEDPKNDNCLDGACFNLKHKAFIQRRVEEAFAKHPGAAKLSLDYSSKTALARSAWEAVKEPEGAAIGVIVESYMGERIGEVVHFKPNKAATAQNDKWEKERLERERKAKIEKHWRSACLEAVLQLHPKQIDRGMVATAVEAWWSKLWGEHQKRVATVLGWDAPLVKSYSGKDQKDFTKCAAVHAPNATMEQLVGAILAMSAASEVDPAYGGDDKPERLLALAKVANVDVEHLKREARERFAPKEPKGKKGAAAVKAEVESEPAELQSSADPEPQPEPAETFAEQEPDPEGGDE